MKWREGREGRERKKKKLHFNLHYPVRKKERKIATTADQKMIVIINTCSFSYVAGLESLIFIFISII